MALSSHLRRFRGLGRWGGFRRGKLADTAAAAGATLDRVQEALQFRDDAREGQKLDRFLSRSPLDRALWLTLDSFLLVPHGDQELRLNRVWPISRTRAEVTGEFAIQSLAIILKLCLSYSPDETLIRVHGARLIIKVDLSFRVDRSDALLFVRNAQKLFIIDLVESLLYLRGKNKKFKSLKKFEIYLKFI